MFENVPEGGWALVIFGAVAILSALKSFTPIFEIMLGKKSQDEKIKILQDAMNKHVEAEKKCQLNYDKLKEEFYKLKEENIELDVKYSNVFAFAVSMEQAIKNSGYATLTEFLEKLKERP